MLRTGASAPLDLGLQGERTALAWSRTALGLGANALLILRIAWTSGSHPIGWIGTVLVAATAVTYVYAKLRRTELLSGEQPPVAQRSAVATIAAFVILAAATSIGAIMTSAPSGDSSPQVEFISVGELSGRHAEPKPPPAVRQA